eukprot:10031230-Ditylum_brightwellii.AAC.1
MLVGTNFNNGTSSGQIRTSGGKSGAINTTPTVASNIGHDIMSKTSNASALHGTFTTEMMALPE